MSRPLQLAYASSVISNLRSGYARVFTEICGTNILFDQEVLEIFNENCITELANDELPEFPLLRDESTYDQATLASMYYVVQPKLKG